MLEPFRLAIVQRGVLEVVLLALAAGILGTYVITRGLTFFAHAVGTAAFPGLVLAEGLGFAAPIGALAAALVFALGVDRLGRRPRTGYDSLTALVLVGALAGGVVLASDVFASGAGVDTLLFGSLLAVGSQQVTAAAITSLVVVVVAARLGPRWIAAGFDPSAARAMGLRSAGSDAVLLALVALTAIASLAAVGALLAAALIVLPAATVRVWTARLGPWQAGAVLLGLGLGIAGLWLAVVTDAPPGAIIATLGGACFAVSVLVRALPPPLRRRTVAAVGVLAAGAVVAIGLRGGAVPAAAAGRVGVVASTTQLAEFARVVGGGRVDVHGVLAPNSDPHDYEPRPSDVLAVARARLVLESGDGLDGWMGRLTAAAGGSPRVVDLAASAVTRIPGEGDGAGGAVDPHWWHDVRNAEAAVATIRDALGAVDPSSGSTYARNAQAYLGRLEALDAGIARCVAAIPASQRLLVSDHDAFGYFARRYGISVVGAVIGSQSSQAGTSARDLARLIALVRREHVRAIFPEHALSPALAHQIAAETGVRADLVLYGDALGPAGSSGATYLTMELANADAMVRGFSAGAFGCRIAGIG